MELTWTKDLSVGNAIIDADHRNLIGMVNKVMYEIRTKDIPTLLYAFESLEGWLYPHFANEEKIAQAIGFPFRRHEQAQQHSLRELRYLKNELAIKEGVWSDGAVKHFTGFLKNWMIDEHIIKLDMQMKPAFQAYDYNFWPNSTRGGITPVGSGPPIL